MKKLFVTAILLIGLVGCEKEVVVENTPLVVISKRIKSTSTDFVYEIKHHRFRTEHYHVFVYHSNANFQVGDTIAFKKIGI